MESLLGGQKQKLTTVDEVSGNKTDCVLGVGGIMLAAVTFCMFPPAGLLATGLAAGGFGIGIAGMARGCGY